MITKTDKDWGFAIEGHEVGDVDVAEENLKF
jgi:hypothetical protein